MHCPSPCPVLSLSCFASTNPAVVLSCMVLSCDLHPNFILQAILRPNARFKMRTRSSPWADDTMSSSFSPYVRSTIEPSGQKRIVCCRHGQSEAQAAGAARKSREYLDCKLTKKGRLQAEALRQKWQADPPELIVVSPLSRFDFLFIYKSLCWWDRWLPFSASSIVRI